MGSLDVISRPALGNIATIGQLYDARADKFLEVSIFKKDIPPNCVTVTDSHFSDIQLINTDDVSEKFHKLNVKAELQVSVLAGLISLEGSGRYLKDQKNSARTVKSSLLYNIKTQDELLNIYHQDLKDGFSLDAIRNGGGTHVIVGICWGANCVLSCQYMNKEDLDRKEVEGHLSATLKQVTFSITGKAGVEFAEQNNSSGLNFEIRIFGDILPNNNEPLPTTVEGGIDLMKQLPSLVQNCNEGKGKPLKYKLIPISLLKDYLKFTMAVGATLRSLDEASLIRVVRLFEEMNKVKQKLNDFHEDVMEHPSCVPVTERTQIISLKEEIALQESRFRAELGQILVKVRSGKMEMTEVEDLLARFRGGNFSPHKIEEMLEHWKALWDKIGFAKELVNNGGKYIGVGGNLDEEIIKNFEAKAFVLYFTKEKTSEPQIWAKNRQIFLQELKKRNCIGPAGCVYYAVDCDFHPDLTPKTTKSVVKVTKNGAVLTEDLLADLEKIRNLPIAYAPTGTVRQLNKPNKRTPLTIRCTGRTCNPKAEYDWQCRRCSEILEWGFDQHVYCTCGKTPVSSLEFKCPDQNHSVNFEKHEEPYFKELLSKLKVFYDMNILIMGETGVGKSTFINAFANFIRHETLDAAVAQKDLVSLIPTKFTMMDENFEQVLVSTGTDPNEIQKPGHSATQGARIYHFPMGKTTIRLIDTPGIGDSRGVQQDKLNFKNILDTIQTLDEIHGICILLKPNNSRLNVMFRFCIKELLTHLHRDACKNIVFCFTNSRGTFYRPGDTMPPLRALLDENKDVTISLSRQTIYCFDSESFRFLAATKNNPPVKFDDAERANYSKSWEISLTETMRLLEHIRTLNPHPVKSTINLNHTREMVLKFTRPLAEITKNIQTNKKIVEDEKQLIERTDEDIKKLKKTLLTTRTVIEVTQLPYPKTVCSNTNCMKFWDAVGIGSQKIAEYTQVCHERCYLEGVQRDTIGHADLIGCDAMTNGNCRHSTCGHSYREHLHVYYDSKQVPKQIEDESVKELLGKKLSAKETKSLLIQNKDNLIKEYEAEQKSIETASAKFAYFLKMNAITPFNDAMDEYLDHFIDQERDKVQRGGTKDTLLALEETKRSYQEEKRVLENAMTNGGQSSVITVAEINQIADMLKNLKHHGKSLKDSLDAVNKTANAVKQYHEVVVRVPMPEPPPKPKPKATRKWYLPWTW